MEQNVFETLISDYNSDNFYYQNLCLYASDKESKRTKSEFPLIVLGTKKVLFFITLQKDIEDRQAAVALRTTLNYMSNHLSVSFRDIVACGVNEEKYFYLNKFNDRITSIRLEDDPTKLFELIENEMKFGPNRFDFDSLKRMNDQILLTSTAREKNEKKNIKTASNGKVCIYKHGAWREASEINTEQLYMTASLFGMFGAHLFFQKKRLKGILYALTFGLCGVGWFFDCIEILFGIYRDPEGCYLVPLKSKLSGFLMLLAGGVIYIAFWFFIIFLFKVLF